MSETIGLMLVIRNEVKRITECLDYHLPYVDEVVVCDQSSTDGTWEKLEQIAQTTDLPILIFQDLNHGYCEPSKQATALKMSSDWILYVDADEKMPLLFLQRMHKLISENPQFNGYNLERTNIFEVQVYDDNVPIVPKVLSVTHPKKDPQLRLSKRVASTFPPFLHHRVRVEGQVCDLPYAIKHTKTVAEQLDDNKRYALINHKHK